MRNSIKNNRLYAGNNSKILKYAFYASLASTLFVLEAFIPKPMPFLKLGLANIIILIIIYSNDFKGAFIVAFAKSIIGTFVTGTIFSPTIILSLGSTLIATSMMILFFSVNDGFSIIGISVIGAVSHNLSQLIFVRIFFINSQEIFYLTPFLILIGIGSGIITGYLSYVIFLKTNKNINYDKIIEKNLISKT